MSLLTFPFCIQTWLCRKNCDTVAVTGEEYLHLICPFTLKMCILLSYFYIYMYHHPASLKFLILSFLFCPTTGNRILTRVQMRCVTTVSTLTLTLPRYQTPTPKNQKKFLTPCKEFTKKPSIIGCATIVK